MTGYASATAGDAPGGALLVEARSVNGRFLDLHFRLPDEMRSLEPALRELYGGAFRRGKIELRVATQRETGDAWRTPGPEQLNRLARLEATVQGWLPQARALSVDEVLQWCRSGGTPGALEELALAAARQCVDALRESRRREGERLAATLQERVLRLRELAAQATPLVPQVVQRQQQRFVERWNEALGTAGAPTASGAAADALNERALAEAAAFAMRIDVAEELSRLGSHLQEIERLLEAGGEVGKKLDFLIQELHREANTLGSKSAALELTAIAVEMKVTVEQMREQVQNIE